MFFTAFYSVILPLGTVITILGLLLTYYVDKINILRKRTIKFTLSTSLCVEMTELIEYVLPIFAASNWLFFYYVTGEQGPVTCVIGVAISCLNFILPMQKINESIFQIEDAQPLKETYE